MKRTPLKARRERPRRNENRITHGRMKRKATVSTPEETAFVKHVRTLGCLICGLPANAHHIMAAPGKERRRDDRFVAPLCADHHTGRWGVHGIGSESGFKAHWGVDLVGWSIAAWSCRNALSDPFWAKSGARCREVARPVLMLHE